MKKQDISHLLRRLYLAKIADTIRFYFIVLKNFHKKNEFIKKYPNTILPPNYLMYESFQLNYLKYYEGGKEDARWIIDLVKKYVKFDLARILDWGCGPARIIRHFPDILGSNNYYFGSDYNAKTIKWCKSVLPTISFNNNGISPPLDFPENYFNFIYGISVLTHLSKINQSLWSKELNRILAPGGIVLLTTHGAAFIEKLTDAEIKHFEENKLVSRVNVIEGHRMYGAFHPPKFIRQVFVEAGFIILEHIPGKRVHETFISQDVWILEKPTSDTKV